MRPPKTPPAEHAIAAVDLASLSRQVRRRFRLPVRRTEVPGFAVIIVQVVIGEFAVGHVDDPIGCEPLENVVVAGDGDETAVDLSAANCFRDGGGADAGHVAIDDAGEFVEGDQGQGGRWKAEGWRNFTFGCGQCSGEIAAKLVRRR